MKTNIDLRRILSRNEKEELLEEFRVLNVKEEEQILYLKLDADNQSYDFLSWYYRLTGKYVIREEQPEFLDVTADDEVVAIEKIEKSISNTSSYPKLLEIAEMVVKELGENIWVKLEDNSRKFLTTGELISITFLTLADMVLLDFSPSVLSYCKAIENELNEKVIKLFKNFLDKDQLTIIKQLKQLQIKRNGRMYYNSKLAYIADDRYFPNKTKLTLGDHGHIIRKFCRNESLDYFEQGYMNVFGNSKEIITIFNKQIDSITTSYRNPSAHYGLLDYQNCIDCREKIIGNKGVLKLLYSIYQKR